ncbi:hypothetical protein Leryth_021185 [Lithospermum erythrorhizon]|nr:hypothetical protein Leryth_021185 [Lithospermum erythrorhizon]
MAMPNDGNVETGSPKAPQTTTMPPSGAGDVESQATTVQGLGVANIIQRWKNIWNLFQHYKTLLAYLLISAASSAIPFKQNEVRADKYSQIHQRLLSSNFWIQSEQQSETIRIRHVNESNSFENGLFGLKKLPSMAQT